MAEKKPNRFTDNGLKVVTEAEARKVKAQIKVEQALNQEASDGKTGTTDN